MQVVHDLRAGPVLRADKLAPNDALAVDDVGFRRPRGAKGEIAALGGIECCAEDDVVVGQVLPVGGRILVKAYGQHNNPRHLLL